MIKILTLTVFLLLSICPILGQTTNTAPIKWQRYKISQQTISVLFPKMPVMFGTPDYCNERITLNYGVYANGVFYGLKVTFQAKEDSAKYCDSQVAFDKNSFPKYLEILKKDMAESQVRINGKKAVKLNKEAANHWLLNDYDNKRWFEFWVVGANEEKKEVADFISSLKLSTKNEEIEIGSGALTTLGDEKVESRITGLGTFALNIPLRPRAKYTDAARQNQVQGAVILRVTFKADGSIGAISPVKGLPDGLTEEAIKAAKRIVFIPAQRDGVPMIVVKQVQYTFTLY